MLDLYLSYIRFIEELIQDGVRVGAFRAHDVEASAFVLNEAIRGCFQQRALGLTARPVTEDARILLDIFFNGVLNQNHKESVS